MSIEIKDQIFDSFINNLKQGFLKKVAMKENSYHSSSFLLFETVVFCSDPEPISIKQVVLV